MLPASGFWTVLAKCTKKLMAGAMPSLSLPWGKGDGGSRPATNPLRSPLQWGGLAQGLGSGGGGGAVCRPGSGPAVNNIDFGAFVGHMVWYTGQAATM